MQILLPQKLEGLPPDDYIDTDKKGGYCSKDIPRCCRMKWLANYIGVSPSCLQVYRAIAFNLVGTYKESCLIRNPEYISRKIKVMQSKNQSRQRKNNVFPDRPPFLHIEAVVLVAIAKLFQELRNRQLVEAYIKDNPGFYLEL